MADIAAPIVCAFLQPIWNSTYRIAERQLKPFCGYKKEVEALESRLADIEEKMSRAERVHLQAVLEFLVDPTKNEEAMKRVSNQWFPKLKGVFYDVDDVLDKWNTVKLMEEIEKSSKKVCCLIPSFYCNRLSLHREMAFDMEALKRKLQPTFENDAREPDEGLIAQLIERLKPATSSLGLPTVYGREKEKETLMSKLNMSESCSTQYGSCVDKTIPILGMGGVGKTTLAQLVCSDETVKNYFVTIWVSVPYKFDLDRVLRSIIEQVNARGARNADAALHTLLDRVVKSIRGKKLLLVLDDVWTVEQREWNQLIATFGECHASSRILVTTQNYDVVQMMGARQDSTVHLELLSDVECWSIVSPLASAAEWNTNGQLDQDLRDKFRSKCNGLPLVAHTLEYQLRFENTKKHWNQDFQSDISDDEKKFFGPFFINYYGLSPLQERCFSYCSVFSRNYRIENDDVVQLWMSQDYFSQSERPEEEGLNCFKFLARRCLFQDSTKDYNGDVVNCKMHELVYEFAQFLTRHERVIMEIQGADEQRSSRKIGKGRHFTLLLKTSEAQIPNSMKKKKNLRTLFVVRSETSTPLNPLNCDLLVKLTCLRTLNLGHCNIEQLPEDLGKLVHLRYLNLSGNSFETLPDELCYLFNLQTLRLKGCTQLQRLPEEMGNLALKFRHLHIEGCDSLKALPKDIGRLTNLRTLDMFVIPCPDDPQDYEALKLEDLNQLEHIHGSIDIRRCRNLENANDLIQKRNLVLKDRRNCYHVNLMLNFEVRSNNARIADENAIFDALRPHPDLMSLEIRGCMDTLYPNWIHLLSLLKRLVLVGCRNWDSLPPLGQLQSLEALQIDDMVGVVNVGVRFLGIANNDRGAVSFPRLKELQFSRLTNWRVWEWTTSSGGEEDNSKIMPCLASLQVSVCGSLEALPSFLRGIRLNLITIDGCTVLNQRCKECVGEDWDLISHIPNIKVDGVTIRPGSVAELQASTSGSNAIPSPGSTNEPSSSMNSRNTCCSVGVEQERTSGSKAVPTPGSSNGPFTSENSSNINSSGAEVQGSTSGSSAVSTPSSTNGHL
ncbi:NB-ARC domain, LRR domain containing protein [Parasponia andersonii]|uniref:NB-ARC domain, LRR domain containing protein n=1 Tax=Parasponia andersonii TaxID=3476 RepID=A0A2P5C3P2_PARAD|nr:NB-ARC domain, LRR domain containing protein [Parasponia andersonii]